MQRKYIRFPGGKAKAFTISYDDGVEQDITLTGLMKKYGIRGTFNINSGLMAAEGTVYEQSNVHRIMTEKAAKSCFCSPLFEVAAHGCHHPDFLLLNRHETLFEVLEDKKELERIFEVVIKGMAYPFGMWNNNMVECLTQCGIKYARTVESTHKFDIPQNWYEWHPTCHHSDEKLMEIASDFIKNTPQNNFWSQANLFYVWGHSYEFEADQNWNVIEALFRAVFGKPDIWFATNIEICEYIRAYNQLDFTLNGRFVQNMSAFDIHGECDGISYFVKSGQTVKIK